MQIMIACSQCGERPAVRPQPDGSFTALCPKSEECPTHNSKTLDEIPEAWNKMQLEARDE